MTPDASEPHPPTHASTLRIAGRPSTPNAFTHDTQISPGTRPLLENRRPFIARHCPITRYPIRPAFPINTASLATRTRIRLQVRLARTREHARLPAD